MVVGAMDKSGTRIEIAGSQRSQRCPRISRVTPVRLDSLRSNVGGFWLRFLEGVTKAVALAVVDAKRTSLFRRDIYKGYQAKDGKSI